MKVKFSSAIIGDYERRCLFDFAQEGVVDLTLQQAQEVLDDALFNADPKAIDLEPGERAAYRALAKQVNKVVAAHS